MPVNIVLFEPEIPPNTGNIIRLASNTGSNLHLIKPLGFELDDKRLRRAGLDYHEFSSLQIHDNWQAFLAWSTDRRLIACSTKGSTYYSDFEFKADDCLVFGPETRGLPEKLLHSEDFSALIKIPMKSDSRSLNLSNSVAIIVYESWKQNHFR